jgi:signal peptidase I
MRIACFLGALAAVAWAASGCGGDGDGRLLREYRIPSPAMAPTIAVGDHVKADVTAYDHAPPERGDIVIFAPPTGSLTQRCGVPSEPTDGHPCERPTSQTDEDTRFIKRVVGMPGDWLLVRNNRIYLGTSRKGPFKAQDEPFIAENSPCGELCNLPKPVRIPADHFFVAGDNRGESDDSRDWGPVPHAALVGKVVDPSG